MRIRLLLAALGACLLAVCALPDRAAAFCGFYVSGAEADLYNEATVVSLMRQGQRTVMSMQNNYEGPAEDFALVVPVPEVLEKEQVKTLEDGVFERLDRLTAPRLVEYWQKDPCDTPPNEMIRGARRARVGSAPPSSGSMRKLNGQVKVEAQFDVGEYEIVVLSSEESHALERWLTDNDYNIPDGAAEHFRPYIERGQYFFVARVDIDKVTYDQGGAVLSPLRFHYDSEDFRLPVRLGLINADGTQDVFAMILSRGQRYRVANYPNVTIPTNLAVEGATAERFGPFYESLFRRVHRQNPEAVVTEYAWNAASCDPCPIDPLTPSQLKTLGTDVLPDKEEAKPVEAGGRPPTRGIPRGSNGNWVVTRLHARYGAEDLGEDLVFEEAPPISGGRGEPEGKLGSLSGQTAESAPMNTFQARYIIRHPWEGEVDCADPNWNRWGGPPDGKREKSRAADGLAFGGGADEADLSDFVDPKTVPVPDRLALDADRLTDRNEPAGGESPEVIRGEDNPHDESPPPTPEKAGDEDAQSGTAASCTGCRAASSGPPIGGLLLVIGLAGLRIRQRSR